MNLDSDSLGWKGVWKFAMLFIYVEMVSALMLFPSTALESLWLAHECQPHPHCVRFGSRVGSGVECFDGENQLVLYERVMMLA